MSISPWQIGAKDYPKNGSLNDQLRFIINYGTLAASSHNTQPWAFYTNEKNRIIFIIPDFERALSISDPTSRQMYISLGCCLANIKLAANYFGWNFNEQIILKKNKLSFIKLNLKSGHTPTKKTIDLFKEITNRINHDGPHLNKSLPPSLEAELKKIFKSKKVDYKAIKDQKSKKEISKLIIKGDQIIFNDKDFLSELAKWIRDITTSRGDGLLTSSLGLPKVLRRYALNIILNLKPEILKNILESDKQKIENSALIGVLSLQKESIINLLKTGEIYQLASLEASRFGCMFAARGVLIETILHKNLENLLRLNGRVEMMFRAGFPKEKNLTHTPRFQGDIKRALKMNQKFNVISQDHPTIIKLSKKYKLKNLLQDLGNEITLIDKFEEHWLPDLFMIRNPKLTPPSKKFIKNLEKFISSNNSEFNGVWVINPIEKTLEHLPNEDEYYEIITASNSRKISKKAQTKIKNLKIGVCGLSGSGSEAVLAIIMSGAKYLRLADFDYVSAKNLNRMEGQVGENKTWLLAWRLWKHNPFLKLDLYPEGITENNIKKFINNLDLVIEQTDSKSKFIIRREVKKTNTILVQVTDMPDPIIDIEKQGDTDFGGRAQKANISEESMSKVSSIEESTGYLTILMDPDKIPSESYENFIDILNNKTNSYSQLFIGAQLGGGVLGRILIMLAENKLNSLPKSFVINTLPIKKDNTKVKEKFLKEYDKKFGLERFNNYFKND